MTTVKISDKYIEVDGHAGDKIVCAMLTALTVSLVNNLTDRLNFTVDYTIRGGHFVMCTDDLDTASQNLVDAYVYSLRDLSRSYPDNIRMI